MKRLKRKKILSKGIIIAFGIIAVLTIACGSYLKDFYHADFGMYGPQEGDGTPTIHNEEQIEQTGDAILKFIGDVTYDE